MSDQCVSDTFSDTAVSLVTFYQSTFSLLPGELNAAELTEAPEVAVAAVASDEMGPTHNFYIQSGRFV